MTSFTTSAPTGYLLIAVAVALLVLPFAFVTRDAPLARTDRPQWSAGTGWWIDPRQHPDFSWA